MPTTPSFRIRRLWRVLLGVGLAFLVYWWIAYPDHSWRQRMTIEVEIAGQMVSGSSVVEVVWHNNHFNSRFATAPAWRQEIRGEAPIVVLPDGRMIFALLSAPDDTEYTSNIAGRVLFQKRGRVWGGNEFTTIENSNETLVLSPDEYPFLVTFTDISDPATVKKLDPQDLAATFGPGVEIKRVTLRITNETATEGRVEEALAWWCDLRAARARLSRRTGPISDTELSNNLGTGSFKVGDC